MSKWLKVVPCDVAGLPVLYNTNGTTIIPATITYATDTDSGLASSIKSTDNALFTVDYLTLIGTGKIANHVPFRSLGRRTALATTVGGDDLWEGVATITPYPDQTVGEQMTLVSTSVNDTSAGSGVQQVGIHYLDYLGNAQHELILMNGTTPVNSIATNIRFVQHIHTERVAALGTFAAGDISLYRTGDNTRVYNIIKTGNNVSLNSQRMVPLGKTFYMTNIKAEATDNKPISVRLRASCDYDGTYTPFIFIYNELFELYNSSSITSFPIPRKFPALCLIKGVALSATAGGTASIGYEGWLE